MAVCEHFFADRETLAAALAARIARRLDEAVTVHGSASLFVSGGSTPVAMFDALSNADIPWPQVTVGLVDERWVAEDHEASNTALVKTHLLTNAAAAARYWPLYRGGDVQDAVTVLRAELPVPATGPTVAHLGIGGDLHTASIFPGAAASEVALADDGPEIVDMFPTGTPANPPFHRVTLTKCVLRRARLLTLLMTGEDKLERYREARSVPLAEAQRAPIAAFMADPRVRLEVYWAP